MKRRRPHRTLVAALIAAAALGLPFAAWFAAGRQAAQQEAQRLEETPRLEAHAEAERVAQRLGARLDALHSSESRRSYLDYQRANSPVDMPACHLPESPLAQGPPDPLVWAHFQIDQFGQLTLPTINGDLPVSAEDRAKTESIQDAIFEQLECSTPDRVAEEAALSRSGTSKIQQSGLNWVASVGEFGWESLMLGDTQALFAMREVQLPTAELRQGFVIRTAELERLLTDAALPAAIRPGEPEGPASALLPVEGATWSVDVYAGAPIARGQREARAVLARFRRTFLGGLVAAIVAGGLLIGMVHQADRLARQRARFAASAAHELRTPLAGLRMYGEMLSDESGDPTKSRVYAQRVAGEADRLGRVVSNLLGYSRLERGALAVTTSTADLGVAVRETMTSLTPSLEYGGARIDLSIEDPLPPVRFDRDALHQILQNLLDNAEKYSREATDRTIQVRLTPHGSSVELSVRDHGPGVPPALRRHLFEPFVRDTAPDAPAGLGLGLALVRALAQAQQAHVTHADDPDGGARFAVIFPAAA